MVRLGVGFAKSERGSISVLVLAGIVLLGGVFSLAVDAGSIYLTKRRLQEAVDLAAIKAVTDPSNAAALAQATVTANVTASSLAEPVAVDPGRYPPTGLTLADLAGLAPDARFEPGAAQPNALRVTARSNAPLFLARLFYSDDATVAAQATAFNRPLTQLALGTGLLTVDSAQSAANDALLSGLLGTSVTLNVASYQGLADANVRLFDFLDALATVTATPQGDYGALLAANVTYAEMLGALATTVQNDPDLGAVAASLVTTLNTLSAQTGSAGSFSLGGVLDIADEISARAAGSRLNLYAIVRASGEASNADNDTVTAVDIPVTGGTVTLRTAVVQPTQMSVVGPEGISVTSAQTRLYLEINPLATMDVLGTPVSIRYPVYIEIAGGQATVTSLACADPTAATAQVDVAAQTGPVSAETSDINTASLHQAAPLATQPAVISNVVGLVQVTASGSQSINGTVQNLTFTAPFDDSNTQRVPLASPFQSVMNTALAVDNVTVSALGLPFPTSVVTGQLSAILNAMVPSVDAVIGDLLQAMGTDTAYMDVSVPYVRCSNPVLAQ